MPNSIIYNNIKEQGKNKSFAFVPSTEIINYHQLLPDSLLPLSNNISSSTICLEVDNLNLDILYRPYNTMDEIVLNQINNAVPIPFDFPEFLMKVKSLKRFIVAQGNTFSYALKEIENGRKVGHWMWYIFPQIAGLGYTETSKYFAIKDLEEAKMYLHNEILYHNLLTICQALLKHDDDIVNILGEIDALKLKSCITLFLQVEDNPIFHAILEKFYQNNLDEKTLSLLKLNN